MTTTPSQTEPAFSLLYQPGVLAPPPDPPDLPMLLAQVSQSLKWPFNTRQEQAFGRAFTERLSLLLGPPGTGKTSVLAGIILGWLERAWSTGRPVCIGVGASNYNAIDKALSEIADLLDRRRATVGSDSQSVCLARLRRDSAAPPTDGRITDLVANTSATATVVRDLAVPSQCYIIGGTWQQLGKLAEHQSPNQKPAALWFDLLVIDEASQVPVATAAAYFLLAKDQAHVVLAGDHKQLGPIYGFQMQESRQGLFDCIFTYMQETHGIQPVALDQNYRTNVEISAWPKVRFYREGYEAYYPRRRLNLRLPTPTGAPPADWPPHLPWSDVFLRILDPAIPIVVLTYNAGTYTVSNPFEAQIVAALAYLYQSVLQHSSAGAADPTFWEQRLGIVTPHRAQRANIRNLWLSIPNTPLAPPPFVDTVDRFQGQERDVMIASYGVADKDFVHLEEAFILDPRRFNVTLTRARSKFVLLISDAIVQHLPVDAQVAKDAAHLQLFVEDYCTSVDERIALPFWDNNSWQAMPCRLRGRREPDAAGAAAQPGYPVTDGSGPTPPSD